MSWFDQQEEERKKRQQVVQQMLSQSQQRRQQQTTGYQPNYKAAQGFFDQYEAKQKAKAQPTVVKQDTSNHHGLLDSLKNAASGVEHFVENKFNAGMQTRDTLLNDLKNGQFGQFAKDVGKTALYNAPGGGGDFLQGVTEGQSSKQKTDNGFQDWEKNFGSNFTAGVGDIVKGTGDVLKWQGADQVGGAISDFGQKHLINGYEKAYSKPFTWSSVFDPEFYSSSIARSMPFTLSMIAPSILGAKIGAAGAGLAANGLKLGKAGQVILRTLGAGAGGSAVSVPFESAFEAGNVYDDAIKKGLSHEEADKMANETFKGNMALLAATQIPEAALTFAHLGGFNPSKLARAGLLAGSAAIEGGQEVGQDIISGTAKGEIKDPMKAANPLNWTASQKESFAAGAVMGGVAGLAGAGGEAHNTPTFDHQRRQAEQNLGGGDPNQIISSNVRGRMSDDLKTEVDNVRDNLEAHGYSPEEIESQLDDFIASTPEGEKLFQEETNNLTNRLTPEQAPTPAQADPAQNGVDEATRQAEAQPEPIAQPQQPLEPTAQLEQQPQVQQPQMEQQPVANDQPQEHPLQSRYTEVMRQYNDIQKQHEAALNGQVANANDPAYKKQVDGLNNQLKPLDKELSRLEKQMKKVGVAVPEGDIPVQQQPETTQPQTEPQQVPESVQPEQPQAHPLQTRYLDAVRQHDALASEHDALIGSTDAADQQRMKELDGQMQPFEKQMKQLEKQMKKAKVEVPSLYAPDQVQQPEAPVQEQTQQQPEQQAQEPPVGAKTLDERRKEHEAKRQEQTAQPEVQQPEAPVQEQSQIQPQGQQELANHLDAEVTPEEAHQDLHGAKKDQTSGSKPLNERPTEAPEGYKNGFTIYDYKTGDKVAYYWQDTSVRPYTLRHGTVTRVQIAPNAKGVKDAIKNLEVSTDGNGITSFHGTQIENNVFKLIKQPEHEAKKEEKTAAPKEEPKAEQPQNVDHETKKEEKTKPKEETKPEPKNEHTDWLKSLKKNNLVWNTIKKESGQVRYEWHESEDNISVLSKVGYVSKVEYWKVKDIVPYENQHEEPKEKPAAKQEETKAKPANKVKLDHSLAKAQEMLDKAKSVGNQDSIDFWTKEVEKRSGIKEETVKTENTNSSKPTIQDVADNSPNVEIVHVGDAPKTEPSKYDPIREKSRKAAEAAKQRLKDKYKGGTTLNSLPFDDLANYAIIGMDIVIQKTLDLAEFTEAFFKELKASEIPFDETILGDWMDVIHMKSNDFANAIENDPERFERMVKTALKDDNVDIYGEQETPAVETPAKQPTAKTDNQETPAEETKKPTATKETPTEQPTSEKEPSTGYWMEKPEQRSNVNFRFRPDEAEIFNLLPANSKPAFLKGLLGNTEPRLAYDVYVANGVMQGKKLELDSKDFQERFKNDPALDLNELRKEMLGYGKGLDAAGNIFQVTMDTNGKITVVYHPTQNGINAKPKDTRTMSYEELDRKVQKDEFSFGRNDSPVWLDDPASFIKKLKQLRGEDLVSNTTNPGTVPNGEAAGGLPGNEKDGQTQTVSNPNGTNTNGTTERNDNGEPNQQSSGERVPAERSGDNEEIPSSPRNVDGNPLPLDHVITENIYESGKKARFNNNIEALKLLKTLQEENRNATPDEQAILAKYQGWGGLSEYFDKSKEEYKALSKHVGDLFTEDEYKEMRNSTTTAFYTNHEVATKMYDILKEAGFTGGRVLEPSVGTGMLVGSMPEEMKSKSKFITVEKDRITHLITKYLYPNQVHYNMGFEKKSLAKNSFDVVIGNVPFGNFGVSDPEYKDRTVNKQKVEMKWATSRIHNYFLVRSMDLLREGGIGVLITSTNTLDGSDQVSARTRKYLYDNADVLDVVRMPNGAFKDAGTDVATDIIFFRKKTADSETKPAADIRNSVWYGESSYSTDENGRINGYLKENPDHIAGDVEYEKDRYGRPKLKYLADQFASKFQSALKKVAKTFKNTFVPAAKDSGINLDNAIEEEWATYEKGLYDGAIHERDGKFVQYTYGKWVPLYVKEEDKAKVSSALKVRDATIELSKMERDKNNKTEVLTPYRDKLNAFYDSFVKKFGKMNDSKMLLPLEKDIRAITSLRSLERKEGKEWVKIDLFRQRQAFPDVKIDVKGNIKEAISVSLANRGELDIPLISELMNMNHDEAIKKMEDENLIFFDPAKREYVTTDEYLSGNVYNKLQFVKGKEEYARNEEALNNIMPRRLTTDQVVDGIRFGQQWIPVEIYQNFLKDKLNYQQAKVSFNVNTASWSVSSDSNAIWATNSHENTNVYGMQDRLLHKKWTGAQIIETLMNQKPLKASISKDDLASYQKEDVERERLTNLLRRKGDQLLEEFRNYIRADQARADKLTEQYNNKFNSYVLRTYDGDMFYGNKPFEGLNPIYTLMKHQKDVVVRTLQQQNALYAHVVGAGKTLEMQVSIMEGRRLGLIRKPVLVVPSFMLEQHSREFAHAYPNAKIKILGTGKTENDIAATKINKNKSWDDEKYKQESEKNRMLRYKSLADVMYGDHDVTIMTYESFERIPMSPEYEAEFLRGEIEKLRQALDEAEGFTVKEIEKAIERLTKQIDDLKGTDVKDLAISFEEIGFDALFVDEAHNFKNLMYSSKMGSIGGLSNSKARRALDMYMKTAHMNKTGAKTVFATGTPIANSVAEMFTMLRYLAPQKLEELGMEHFDGWAAQFGTTINSVELNTSGKFVEKTRFAEFTNVPELMNMFKDVADVKMAEDLPYLKRPEVTRETVTAPMSENQKTFLEIMIKRAEAVGSGIEPFMDNMLKLTGEGKKLALDYRIIDGKAVNEKESKLNVMAEHIADEYFKTKTGNVIREDMQDKFGKTFDNGTQLVFLDLGVPKASDTDKGDGGEKENADEPESNESVSMYQNLKDRLLELGVNPKEIAFIHDYNKPDQKKKLSELFNEGKIRIIIGSTGKMGVGMNLQTRLTALHHADPTWRPADIEQREGRIIRQGNWNPTVKVKTHVTEGSFDALMWNTLENKAKFIAQVMSGGSNVRSMDEIAELILSYSEIKASATNNEAMKKLLTTEKDLRLLRDLEGQHNKDQAFYANRLKALPKEIDRLQKRLVAMKEAENAAVDITGDGFNAEMDGVTYSVAAKPKDAKDWNPRKAFREALMEKAKAFDEQELTHEVEKTVAVVGGLPLRFVARKGGKTVNGEIKYDKRVELSFEGSNGEKIEFGSLTTTQTLDKEGAGLMLSFQNAIRPLSQHAYSPTRQKEIERNEAALKEAKEKGNVPFPEKQKLESLISEVADLRDQARQYELTNANDSVFERNGEFYVVSGIEYQEVPSKNKKKQAEDKPDYVTAVNVTRIGEIHNDTEYLDENNEHRTVNVFVLDGASTEKMRDIEFIRDFKRRDDVNGLSDSNYQKRLSEIERIKKEREAQAAENAKNQPVDDLGIADPVEEPAPKEAPKAENEPFSEKEHPTTPHKRMVKEFGTIGTVEQVDVNGKKYWTLKASVGGARWEQFVSTFKKFGGEYHRAKDPVEAFQAKVVFDEYPEGLFEKDNGAKAFSLAGGDTMEHNVSPKTAQQVSHKIAKALKTVLRTGNVGKRKALASFEAQKYAGNVKNKWLHNLRVTAHELGHAFEERGFVGDDLEIMNVGELYYPAWNELKSQAVKMSEGRAELFTLYILDREEALALAPTSVNEIEGILSRDPKIEKIFNEVQDIMEKERNKGDFERAIGSIQFPSEKRMGQTIGDEYQTGAVPEGLGKTKTAYLTARGYVKRQVARIVDFKVPWNDVQKVLDKQNHDGKDIVKMLALTGNAEMHARNTFESWARDHRGRYIINYENASELPTHLAGLYNELNDVDPRKITKKQKEHELYARYEATYKQSVKAGLDHGAAKEKAVLQAISSRSLAEVAEDGMVLIAKAVQDETVSNGLIGQAKNIKANKGNKESVEYMLFSSIIQAYRANERYSREDKEGNQKFKEVYMDEAQASRIVAAVPGELKGLEELVKEYTSNLSNIILTKLVEAGVETQEARDRVENGSDFYVPTYYAEKSPHLNGDAADRKTAGKPIRGFKGRNAVAVDVLRATTYKLLEVEQSIEFKRVLDEIENGIKQPNMGVFGEVISPQLVPKMVDGGKISKQVGETLRTILGDDVVDSTGLEEAVAEKVFTTFFPAELSKQKILMNWHGDKKVYMRLSADLYNSIVSMKPVHVNGLMRWLAKFSSVTRRLAITNPRYIFNVMFRDFFGSGIQNNAEQNFVKGYMKGMALAAGKDPMIVDQYITSGAFASAQENMLDSFKRANITDGLIDTKVKGWKKTKAGKFVHLFTGEDIIKWQEQIARYGVWEAKARELAVEYGIDPAKIFDGRQKLTEDEQGIMENILLDLGYEASEITTNFRTHGTSEGWRRTIAPVSFLHGSLQGIYREAREMHTNPKRTMKRMALVLAPMSILSWALLQALDPDDKDDITSDMKDKYWIIPVGNHYFFIAKPFGYTIPLAYGERLLDHITGVATGDDGARSWNEHLLYPFEHNFTLPFLPIYGQTALELYANKSWNGGSIVTDTTGSKFNQIDSKTSKLAELQAKAEFALFGNENMVISPDQFDYAVKGIFGGAGQLVSGGIDKLAGKDRTLVSSSQLGFVPKEQTGSRLTDKFYTAKDNAEKEYDRQILNGEAEKGHPTDKVKFYRTVSDYMRDMRKVREYAKTQDVSTEQRANLDKQIVNALNDLGRYGAGAKIKDQANLEQVISWVEQYRKMK